MWCIHPDVCQYDEATRWDGGITVSICLSVIRHTGQLLRFSAMQLFAQDKVPARLDDCVAWARHAHHAKWVDGVERSVYSNHEHTSLAVVAT